MASTPWDKALVKCQAGDFEGALALLEKAVAQAERARGVDHPDFAEACAHLAEIRAAIGDRAGAIEALGRAVAARLPGPPGQRDHVAYVLQLGELQRENGDLAEAEATQRAGLEARERLHGAGTAGHAVGQIALGEVLVDQDRLADALALLEAALKALWQHGHGAVGRAIALRALCIKGVEGTERASLQPLAALPGDIFSDAVQQVFTLVDRPGRAAAALAVLQELEAVVSERLPGALRDLYQAMAEAAALAGDGHARLAALVELEALAPHPADRVEVLLERAQAEADLGTAGAERTWAQALAAAELLDHPELLITARRLAGAWLARQGRPTEAEPLLRAAVDTARAEDLWEALGRAALALGRFLATGDEAIRMLREGVARLPPGDPEADEAEALLAAQGVAAWLEVGGE